MCQLVSNPTENCIQYDTDGVCTSCDDYYQLD